MAGGPAGDLYITIRVDEHPFFKRDGDNINIQIPLTVSEAGLGAKIEVPTIDGRALLKIRKARRTARNSACAKRASSTAGRILAATRFGNFLQAPDVGDERTRELLRELAQVQTEDVRSDIWAKVQPAA